MELQDPKRSRVRIHRTTEFKARMVELALKPGASVSGIAVEHGVNPNLLRRWIKESDSLNSRPAFVPVRIESGVERLVHIPVSNSQRIDIRIDRGELCIQFKVDPSQMSELGQVLREVLR